MQYIPYEYLGVTAAVIAAALAFVVLVWNAVRALHEWRQMAHKPTDDRIEDHEKRISHLEECCEEVTDKLDNDWEFQQATSEVNKLMLLSIKQLLKHSIDGNDTKGLAEVEEKIDLYLVEHQK